MLRNPFNDWSYRWLVVVLNEVLSLNAQEYFRLARPRGRPSVLNEVLSLNAQEFQVGRRDQQSVLSSMKS